MRYRIACLVLAALLMAVTVACDREPTPAQTAAGNTVTTDLDKSKEGAMPRSKVLVVYYSRTGTTRTLAEAIARAASADLEPIFDTVERGGMMGFLRSLRDAIRKQGTTLKPPVVDPGAYELVIVGTPDWGKSMAAPVRTYLTENHGRFARVAFFLTDGTADHAAIFQEMATLCGCKPEATLGIPHDEVTRGQYADKVEAFVRSLLPGPQSG